MRQGIAIVFTLWHIIGMWLARKAIFRLIAILRETTKVLLLPPTVVHGSHPPLTPRRTFHFPHASLSPLPPPLSLHFPLAARLTPPPPSRLQVYKQMTLILVWPIFSIIGESIVFISGMLMFYFMVRASK